MAETLLLQGLAAGTLVARYIRTCHVDPIAAPAGCTGASPRACCCSASSCPRLRLRRLVTNKVAWCRPGFTTARWLKARCACSSHRVGRRYLTVPLIALEVGPAAL